MELDWLAGFVAFAEQRNFTRAAALLHLSQPALHVKVARLAEELGAPLYHRVGRELVLTDEGRRTEAFARDVLSRVEAFQQGLRSGIDERPPTLAAGAGTHLYLLAEPLRRWVAGGHALAVRTADADGVVEHVRAGRAQLGVAPATGPTPDLIAQRLTRVGQIVVVADGHPLASRQRVTARQLADHDLLLPPRDRPHRVAIDDAVTRAAGRPPRVAMEATGWDLLLHYASLGIGAAVVNDFCPPPPGTRAIAVSGLPTLDFRLVRRADTPLPERARALGAHLRAAFATRD